MEQNKKNELLLKYENGETTLQEERELSNYFLENELESETAAIFALYQMEKKIKWNSGISIAQKSNMDTWLALAACLVLVFGLVFVLIQNKQNNFQSEWSFNPSNHPEIVLKETQNALNLLSGQVNSGIRSMRYLKEYQKSKNKIFRE